ncbi:MAG TPA: hypothetical protein VJX74_10835, partial [Blastocatellia bacterium]|nr:hypothetical protein [Blastocatellia bacterium]
KIRQQLLNWLYFKRTQKAINEGSLDDARQLSEKVEQLDLRAYLSYEIAAEALRRFEDRTRVREILDAVAAAALKTDNSNEKARTLLGISHLYSKVDHARAFEVMTDAVKTINRITDPDLNNTGLSQRIEGPQFGYLARYDVDGFSLENAFRELAPFDFDRALLVAKALENKTLRSTAVITLAAFCLEIAQKQQSRPPQTVKKPRVQKTPDQRRKP